MARRLSLESTREEVLKSWMVTGDGVRCVSVCDVLSRQRRYVADCDVYNRWRFNKRKTFAFDRYGAVEYCDVFEFRVRPFLRSVRPEDREHLWDQFWSNIYKAAIWQ